LYGLGVHYVLAYGGRPGMTAWYDGPWGAPNAGTIILNKKSRSAATALFDMALHTKSLVGSKDIARASVGRNQLTVLTIQGFRVQNEASHHEALEVGNRKVSLALILSETN
jgi:hypothetical protein